MPSVRNSLAQVLRALRRSRNRRRGITVLLEERVIDLLGSATEATLAREARAVVGAVHDVATAAPRVSVFFDASLDDSIAGYFIDAPNGWVIGLNKTVSDLGFSELHEIGHYLDAFMGQGGGNASDIDPLWEGWRDAVAKSAGVGALAAAVGTPVAATVLPNGQTFGDYISNYLLTKPEMFARSYSQWVVSKCADSRLRKELAQTMLASYPDQWTATDFSPIGEEFDRVLESLKWA